MVLNTAPTALGMLLRLTDVSISVRMMIDDGSISKCWKFKQ